MGVNDSDAITEPSPLIMGLVDHLAKTIPWTPQELLTGGLLSKGFTPDQIQDILEVIDSVGSKMNKEGDDE